MTLNACGKRHLEIVVRGLALAGLVLAPGWAGGIGAAAEEPGRAAELLELGRYSEVEQLLSGLTGQARTPEIVALQARLAWVKGDPDRSEALTREALALQESRTGAAVEVAPYRASLGKLLFDRGRLDEAEAAFRGTQKALDAEHARLHQLDIPHDHAAYYNRDAALGLARVHSARGDAKKAERAWKQVLARWSDPRALVAAGESLAAQGKSREAESAFDRAERAAAADPRHRRDLARILVDRGRDLDRALEIARDEAGRREDVETWDLLAWALFKKGLLAEATEAAERALRLGTPDASIRFHAGMIYLRAGAADRGRSELERALALNPHFSPRDAGLARAALAGQAGAAAGGSNR